MGTIHLPNRFSDNFGDPIQHLFKILADINQMAADEEIILNYNNAKFTHPFFSLALPLIQKEYSRQGRAIKLQHVFKDRFTFDYMGYLNFPEGIDPMDLSNLDFASYLSRYKHKTYLPIISFPVGESQKISEVRDQFLSAVNQLLVGICCVSYPMNTALMYLIDEAVNNVLHHSNDLNGYLLAQYYPSKGYVDIVIADIGRTLLESYKNSDKYTNSVNTHAEAMEAALEGKSTKSNNIDRGFGISTSKQMLTIGLNGKYFLWSGNVFNIHTSEINNVVKLPETISWQGVYLCLRIPVVPKPGFNPFDFYE